MKLIEKPVGLVAALCLSGLMIGADTAYAHGGGLNAQGCHNERRTGGYHCHRSPGWRRTPSPRTTAQPTYRSPVHAINQGVYCAQLMLDGLGYDVGSPDGIMGPNTERGIRAFERVHGMVVTGRVTERLLDELGRTSKLMR